MNLVITSPYGQEIHVVQWIEAHTPEGSVIIQPGHAPLIVTLAAQKSMNFLLKTGEQKSIFLDRPAFLEITRTVVNALINQVKI